MTLKNHGTDFLDDLDPKTKKVRIAIPASDMDFATVERWLDEKVAAGKSVTKEIQTIAQKGREMAQSGLKGKVLCMLVAENCTMRTAGGRKVSPDTVAAVLQAFFSLGNLLR